MPDKEKETEGSEEILAEKGGTQKAPLKFHLPEPGEPNPEVPSNDGVYLGTSLPTIKAEE